MIPVVLDASVVGAACGWTSEPYQCVEAGKYDEAHRDCAALARHVYKMAAQRF